MGPNNKHLYAKWKPREQSLLCAQQTLHTSGYKGEYISMRRVRCVTTSMEEYVINPINPQHIIVSCGVWRYLPSLYTRRAHQACRTGRSRRCTILQTAAARLSSSSPICRLPASRWARRARPAPSVASSSCGAFFLATGQLRNLCSLRVTCGNGDELGATEVTPGRNLQHVLFGTAAFRAPLFGSVGVGDSWRELIPLNPFQ